MMINNSGAVPLFSLFRPFPCAIILAMFFFEGTAMASGEKFSDQGRALATEIDHELINRGICQDSRDCSRKLSMYGEHGNRVNFNIYGIDDKNRKILAIVIQLVIDRGMRVTQGTPIGIQAFPKAHDEYVNFKNFFSKKPIIKLEIYE